MQNESATGLGIHFSVDGVRAAFASAGQITQLGLTEPVAEYLAWLKLPSGGLSCAAAPELIGVERMDDGAGKALLEVFRRLGETLNREARGTLQVAIAVPRALPEPQRRRLLASAEDFFGRASLIDSTSAALHASLGTTDHGEAATVAIVAEDLALEMSASAPNDGSYAILGYRSVPELSVHALNHHLFQKVIDRLPMALHEQLAAAADQTLSAIFRRLVRSGTMLSRLDSMSLSLVELASPPPTVALTAQDVTAWLEPRQDHIRTGIEALAIEVGRRVGRIVLVGRFGEWPALLASIEQGFELPLVYGMECIADGAALAAAASPLQDHPPTAAGALTPLEKVLAGRSFVTFGQTRSPSKQSPEETLQEFFVDIAKLVADRHYDQVRHLLLAAKQRADGVLAALTSGGAAAVMGEAAASTPAPALGTGGLTEAGRAEIVLAELPARARRGFDEAERLLRAGRVLEAVGTSHLMHERALNSHEALMYMLDIHRRGARVLAENGDYAVAAQQLRCALLHRHGDERTRRALGEVLVTQAAHEENVNRDYAEAQHLYEEALEYIDDEAVAGIERSLQRLQQLLDPHD